MLRTGLIAQKLGMTVSHLVLYEPMLCGLLHGHRRADAWSEAMGIYSAVQKLGDAQNWQALAEVFTDYFNGDGSWTNKVLTILFVALVFGVINAFIKPIVRLFSLPFIVLTLGLFTFIVNAFMLQITECICDWLNLDFTIDDFFWDAVLGAIVITMVSWVLNLVLPDDD